MTENYLIERSQKLGLVGPKCLESWCLWGAGGSGKTTQASFIARLLRELFGEKAILRLASCNADGWQVIQPDVDDGYIQPLWMGGREYFLRFTRRLCQGWWPDDPTDPKSPLLPPDKQKGLENVKATMFDSGTDIARMVKRFTLDLEAKQPEFRVVRSEKGGDAAHFYYDGPDDDKIGWATPSLYHYGSWQSYMEGVIVESKDIAGQFVIWTFLEDKGKDPVTQIPIYGPDIIGDKLSPYVPTWFGRTIHLVIGKGEGDLVPPRRMYLRNHTLWGNPTQYLANVRDYWKNPLPLFLEGEEANMYSLYKKLQKSFSELRRK